MKRKTVCGLLLLMSMLSVPVMGCGNKAISTLPAQTVEADNTDATVDNVAVKPNETENKAENTESESKSEEPVAGTEAAVSEDTEEKDDVEKPVNVSEEEETETTSDTDSKETASGTYMNLDSRQFSINGKTYTLGKTTLQEMIDDGVPFQQESLDNASNNLNSNTTSAGFKITLGDYWTAQVFVLNDTDSGKPMSECYINEIYMPVKQDKTQNVISFSFPTNISKDDLIANSGEPTEEKTYGSDDYVSEHVNYTREASRYYGNYGYKLEYTNGKLQYITIDYMP